MDFLDVHSMTSGPSSQSGVIRDLRDSQSQSIRPSVRRQLIEAKSTALTKHSQASSSWRQEVYSGPETNEVLQDSNSGQVTVDSESEIDPAPVLQTYSYSIKVTNPLKMSEFCTADLGQSKAFMSIDSLRKFVSSKLPMTFSGINRPDMNKVDVGYVEPGHGMKGKKVWFLVDNDLSKMYDKYGRNTNIRLWCYTVVTKMESTKKGPKEKESDESNSDVEKVYEQLHKKHQGKYTVEQLRTWSHMIRLKTHDSLETPPDKPFFRGRKRQITFENNSESKRVSSGVSPGRKVNIRSELINQLDKWHKLLDAGVISQEEYSELKGKILSDIKGL